MKKHRGGRTRIEDIDEYDDMSRQILGEYEREKVPQRVLAERHGTSIATISRRMQDARWMIKQEQK